MTQEFKLAIQRRGETGSTSSRKLRGEGKAPGVLYGHGGEPTNVAFDARAFDDLLHRGARTALVTLTLDGKSDTALIREVQRDPVTRRVVHADLQRVSAHESVHARLPIATIGVALGVREFGGVMDVMMHELEVEGPADRLPDRIEIDVSALGIHEHVTAGQAPLPPDFKMLTPADTIVVSIESSKTAHSLEESAAAATTEQAVPEVIGAKPAEGAPE
ncbi:MAG: 50S ribosomal protein L25 [Vulcanimicrobiaceae bacterium]